MGDSSLTSPFNANGHSLSTNVLSHIIVSDINQVSGDVQPDASESPHCFLVGSTLASTGKDVLPQDHLSAFDANAHSLSSSMPSHTVECDNHHVLDVVHPAVAVSSSVLSRIVDCDAHTARAQVKSCASCLLSPAKQDLVHVPRGL